MTVSILLTLRTTLGYSYRVWRVEFLCSEAPSRLSVGMDEPGGPAVGVASSENVVTPLGMDPI